MHVYLTRFTKDDEYYYKKLREFVPRFMSEWGFSSLPVEDSYFPFNFFNEKLDLNRNPWLGQLPWLKEKGWNITEEELIYFTQYKPMPCDEYWIEYMRSWKESAAAPCTGSSTIRLRPTARICCFPP